ncbi:hypothetical protein [Streptomyces sp. MUM 178J]|uniref:hypothetical protein n=1 Tax=Streptomyces sp. MUM 178J TaxID=2791991 RepID=UPI001F0431AB|nr:hypothetical protein [Streptomyces sp. MUM 178J]WRQ78690.1 hypothetical protein I3F59_004455 [Streptomyces sp. MUM 178J]
MRVEVDAWDEGGDSPFVGGVDLSTRQDPARVVPAQQGSGLPRGWLVEEGNGLPFVGGVEVPEVLDALGATLDAAASRNPEVFPEEPFPAGASQARSDPGKHVLRVVALLLPGDERSDWLEEQRGYLADMFSSRARWAWIAAQLIAMPRYVYAVRTGSETESM